MSDWILWEMAIINTNKIIYIIPRDLTIEIGIEGAKFTKEYETDTELEIELTRLSKEIGISK